MAERSGVDPAGRWAVPWRAAPALGPAITFVLSVHAGREVVEVEPAAALGLLAASLAAGGRLRRLGASLAAGLLLTAAAAEPSPPVLDRPVELVAAPQGEWRRETFGWRVWVRSRHYRQGLAVGLWQGTVLVHTSGEDPPPSGRLLRLRGHLSRRPAPGNPAPRGPGPWTLTVKRPLLTVEAAEGSGAAALRRLRDRLDGGLLDLGRERPGVALARALVLGRREALPESWLAGLRRLGLAHVAALSGLHVGLVAGLVLGLARPLPAPRARALLAGLAVLAYLLVAGIRPSLLRAAVMASVVVASAVAERRHVAWNAWALAAAGLVAWRPEWVEDPGYLLSVAATAGLLWGGEMRGAGPRRLLGRIFGAGLCAQLAAAPWVLTVFHVVQPLAPLWNLLAAPWLAGALLGAVVLTLAAAGWRSGAEVVAPLVDLCAAPLAWSALRPPDRFVTLAAPPFVGLLGLSVAALAAWRRWPGRTLGALVVAVAVARCGGARQADPELALLDVGQGTAVLLRHGGEALLVDGGGWPSGDVARAVTVPALGALGLDGLSSVVLTHPDLDHCRGLHQVAAVVPTAEIWMVPGWPASSCLRRLLAAPGPRLRVLLPGDGLQLGAWRLRVLHPSPAFDGGDNDRSLVLRAEARGRVVLLTGDLQAAGERALVAGTTSTALRADVLLVPHHGSRTSTGGALLAAVAPRLALISAGRSNPFGHPHREVIDRLRSRGIPRLSTAESGWVRLRIDAVGRLHLSTPAAPVGP